MRYLYDFESKANYLTGTLEDLFWEELENNHYEAINYEDEKNSVYFDNECMMAKINKTKFVISDIDSYCFDSDSITIYLSERRKSKMIRVYCSNKKLTSKLIKDIEIIIKSKADSLNKYNQLKDNFNKNYVSKTLVFKFENEKIFNDCFGDFEKLDKVEKVEAVNLFVEKGNLFFIYKNEKVLIPDLDCRELKKLDINSFYCSEVEFQPLFVDYICRAEFHLFVDKSSY